MRIRARGAPVVEYLGEFAGGDVRARGGDGVGVEEGPGLVVGPVAATDLGRLVEDVLDADAWARILEFTERYGATPPYMSR